MANGLLSGQGVVSHAPRDGSGQPGDFKWGGNAPDFVVSLATETLEHKESYTGKRLVDSRITTETNATISITVDDFKEANLELGLYGTAAAIAGGAVVDEAVLATVPKLGEIYSLKSTGRVSAVTLEGNAVLIDAEQYEVDASGNIQFLDLTDIAAPITASYTNAASRRVAAFKTSAPERYVRLASLNTAVPTSGGDFTRRIINLFRTRFDPTENIGLINDEFATMVLNGSVLVDPLRSASGDEGQFLEIIDLDPPA
jgi:hypothetical protein